MKKAFTLIELIVVVGILAVLIGTLVAALSGGTDAARAARCLTNLKNLATACNSYAMASSCYPLAGSVELRGIDRDSGSSGEISPSPLKRVISADLPSSFARSSRSCSE